ncbi:MAG: hypothetical protein Q8N51_17045, partial [Gammaproteobacteria bacterium]|nr:hypothetical protein [Gammaproteobacteria bacterium]
GTTTFTDGTVILGKVGALGTGTFAFNGGFLEATTDLTGGNRLTNALQFNNSPTVVQGSQSIEFGSATATTMGAGRLLINNISGVGKQLIFSSNITNTAAAVLTIAGTGNTLISGLVTTGSGAQGIANSGTGTITLTAANNATGALTANRGLTVLSGANGAWTAGTFTLNSNGTLQLDNSGTNNDNRLSNTGVITFNGGILHLIGNGTTEAAGALTVNGIMGTINMTGSGSNTLSFGTVNFANSGSSLDLSSISGLGTTNKVLFSAIQVATVAYTNPILPRMMILGDFARYDTTDGVMAFSGYNMTNDLNAAAATDTMEVTESVGLTANRVLNALKIEGSNLIVGTAGRNLTLTAGALLNTGTIGTSNTFTGGQLILTQQGWIQVDPGTTLNMNAAIVGNTINKVGAGTLNINTRTYHNTTTNISGGMVVLDGGLNTLFANGTAAPGQVTLDVGATLDLNGNTQYVGALTNSGASL